MKFFQPHTIVLQRGLTAWVLCCLLGIQAVGLAHQLGHSAYVPGSTGQQQIVTAHAHTHDWLAGLIDAACVDKDHCAALDQLLLWVALPAAALVLALLAAHHTLAARLVLARGFLWRCSAYPRGPPA